MTLAPFEVERREFGTAAFGYKKREVDSFLSEVHGTLGKLWEERSDLREELERLTERTERYAAQEHQLVDTLRLAQESANKATEHARKEAELTLREATQTARDIVHSAHDERQQLDTVVRELRAAEREARHRLRSLATAVLTGIDDDQTTTESQARSLRAVVSGNASASSSGADDSVTIAAQRSQDARQVARRPEPRRRSQERVPEIRVSPAAAPEAAPTSELGDAADAKPFGRPPRFERSERAPRVETSTDA